MLIASVHPDEESMSVIKLLKPYVGKHLVLLAVGTVGTIIGALLSFSIGLAIKYFIDSVPPDAQEGYAVLNRALLVALTVVTLSTAIGFITGYSLVKVAMRVIRDLRVDVFSSLIGQRVSYLEQHSSGELQTRIVSDADIVGGFSTQQVPKIVTASISVIAGTVGALFISGWLTMIVLAFLPFVFLPAWIWGGRLRNYGAQIQQRTADLGKETGEIFRNIKLVHVYNKEAQERSRFRELADAIVTTVVRAARLQTAMSSSVSLMAMIALLFLLWTAARNIYSGALTLGQLMSFAYFNILIIQSVGAFFGFVTSLKQTTGAAQRLMGYLLVEAHPWPRSASPVSISGAIEFRDVHFKYPARSQIDVLKGISFVVEAGANTVIVGPSGAGKSALFELLLGLYSPDAGHILIDGRDSREFGRGQLCSFVGYVPQKEILRSGTVFDNIIYGAGAADEAKVVEAAEVACAHEFIVQLPQGYQTDLGEVAARLSGGERQRICLARALIREPRILLLDEDKSALDADSERRVSGSVRKWAASHGATVISIAHRLSSIGPADRILVVDDGVIVGHGSHADLLRGCETYRNLVFRDSGEFGAAFRAEVVRGDALDTVKLKGQS
jgi:ATP-binding cassette subfamily B protein